MRSKVGDYCGARVGYMGSPALVSAPITHCYQLELKGPILPGLSVHASIGAQFSEFDDLAVQILAISDMLKHAVFWIGQTPLSELTIQTELLIREIQCSWVFTKHHHLSQHCSV